MLIPLKNKISSQTVGNNLPHIAQYMNIVEGIIKERILAETGEVFRLNDYTILVNSPHGTDCQEPHMDHKLYCKCHKRKLLTLKTSITCPVQKKLPGISPFSFRCNEKRRRKHVERN
jgi:hypothetical protein